MLQRPPNQDLRWVLIELAEKTLSGKPRRVRVQLRGTYPLRNLYHHWVIEFASDERTVRLQSDVVGLAVCNYGALLAERMDLAKARV